MIQRQLLKQTGVGIRGGNIIQKFVLPMMGMYPTVYQGEIVILMECARKLEIWMQE